jgi:hypothetical protein
MPAFNFKKQFADLVEKKIKRQIIRAKRADGRNPHVGDILYLYTGMRTKGCRKLGESICKSVEQITIYESGIVIDGKWITSCEEELKFVYADGFDNAYDFFGFFNKEHGLPFEGLLYKW